MTDSQPKTLADALLHLLKARGLTAEAALTVLGQVIVESPAYRGEWSTPVPTVSDETRQQLAERTRTSERLLAEVRHRGSCKSRIVPLWASKSRRLN